MFAVLQRDATLASRVTDQLEGLILERHLQPGDRLPAERDLAAKYGVSRTVIREAVRSLMARGMVEVKPGSGTAVSTPSAKSVTQSMTLFLRGGRSDLDHKKVMEVRRLLEVEIAGLAAQRRTDEDLIAMEEILMDSEGIRRRRERFVEWDLAFHAALAAATHNELFSLLLDSVAAIMIKVRELGFDVPATPDQAMTFHRAILREVKKGRPDAARRAMRAHLTESEDTMRRALALRTAQAGKGRRQ